MPNFGIRVSQGGAKTFVALLGSGNRHTIGRYPVISLSEARTEAKRILAEHTLGKHRPQSLTWDAGRELFLADCEQRVKERTLRARTLSDYRRLLKKHFALGRQQLAEITSDHIGRRIERITDAPSERNHALVAVKVFLSWAQKPPRRYISHNPCEGMVATKRPARKRVLTDDELAAVYRTALKGEDAFSQIVAILILTGQRRGEIGALRRDWINPKERTITLPDFITKNKAEHKFPYGPTAAAILKHIPDQGDCLFPASRSHVRGKPTTTFNGWPKHKEAFDKACGVSGWTLHDLRRTFATGLAALKVPPHIVERLLNHKFGSLQNQTDGTVSAVAEIYNRHLYMNEMREAIKTWETRLRSLLKPR
jgi:integrase